MKIQALEGRTIPLSKLLPPAAVLILFVALSIGNPRFFSPYNIGNIMDFAATYLLAGLGLTFVILIGSIDLSIGAMISLDTIVFIIMINAIGFWAYPIIVVFGTALGLVNGILFTKLKIPSFIVTLGTAGIFMSIALLVSGAGPIGLVPRRIATLRFFSNRLGPFSITHAIGIALFVVLWIVQNYTVFGKTVFAVGNAESAARLSGMQVARTKIICFCISGLFTAIASVVIVSIMMSAAPATGPPYLLLVIATVVIGGTSLSGGLGGVVNTMLGSLLLSMLGNGMNVVGIDVYYQQVLHGVIIIAAVALTLNRSQIKIVK